MPGSPDTMRWGQVYGFIAICLIKESRFLISNCNGNYKVAHGNIMLHNETYLNVIKFKPSIE